ncbi:MAG: tRNA (guanosine(46)-N7)-methyltransferase TrmB [Bacteroidales bacterium]|nr:tRNA (guanosine(46)-N7)-methyltransferase TrmB [Bacteroidales bacterium]
MGKGKLQKFAENETFACLIQPSLEQVLGREHPLKGHWGRDFFHNDHPIVLELGCGKGDYTIALALRHPEINYIGVDIKGARMWKGAKTATQAGLNNVGFLRTRIEFIGSLFGPDEVSEIWLTFSDPQIGREKKRLTSPRFLARYADFLRPDGTIHLKTDSRYLYEYTHALCRANGLPVAFATHDLYALDPLKANLDPALFEVRTFYEKHFLAQGYRICYLAFTLAGRRDFLSPEWDEARWADENHHAFLIQIHE